MTNRIQGFTSSADGARLREHGLEDKPGILVWLARWKGPRRCLGAYKWHTPYTHLLCSSVVWPKNGLWSDDPLHVPWCASTLANVDCPANEPGISVHCRMLIQGWGYMVEVVKHTPSSAHLSSRALLFSGSWSFVARSLSTLCGFAALFAPTQCASFLVKWHLHA